MRRIWGAFGGQKIPVYINVVFQIGKQSIFLGHLLAILSNYSVSLIPSCIHVQMARYSCTIVNLFLISSISLRPDCVHIELPLLYISDGIVPPARLFPFLQTRGIDMIVLRTHISGPCVQASPFICTAELGSYWLAFTSCERFFTQSHHQCEFDIIVEFWSVVFRGCGSEKM